MPPPAGIRPRPAGSIPDLQELSLGAYDGLTRDEIPDFAGLAALHPAPDSFFFHCPGGVTWAAMIERVDRARARLDPAAETIVFAHGISGKLLRGRVLGLDPAASLALSTGRRMRSYRILAEDA